MDYEEIKLMIANRQAEETKNNMSKQKVLYENSSRKQDDYSFYNKLYEQDTVGEDFYRFKTQLTESYVTEALTILVDNCVEPVLINEVYNQKLVRQLVSNFVKEEGASNLLNKFRHTSYLLSEIAYICDNHIKAVLESTDKDNKETFKLNKNDKKTFYDDLSKVDAEDTINKITNRVKHETEEFVNNNIENNNKIKETIEKTKDKVDSTKAKNEETTSKIQESYLDIGKREIVDIRESGSKTVLECMIYNMSKAALINESANRVFVEDSKLNMDKIVEHCEVLYTFLTTLDSCKLINVDEQYIENMLKDMCK